MSPFSTVLFSFYYSSIMEWGICQLSDILQLQLSLLFWLELMGVILQQHLDSHCFPPSLQLPINTPFSIKVSFTLLWDKFIFLSYKYYTNIRLKKASSLYLQSKWKPEKTHGKRVFQPIFCYKPYLLIYFKFEIAIKIEPTTKLFLSNKTWPYLEKYCFPALY